MIISKIYIYQLNHQLESSIYTTNNNLVYVLYNKSENIFKFNFVFKINVY